MLSRCGLLMDKATGIPLIVVGLSPKVIGTSRITICPKQTAFFGSLLLEPILFLLMQLFIVIISFDSSCSSVCVCSCNENLANKLGLVFPFFALVLDISPYDLMVSRQLASFQLTSFMSHLYVNESKHHYINSTLPYYFIVWPSGNNTSQCGRRRRRIQNTRPERSL
jgi:hypothetical protein